MLFEELVTNLHNNTTYLGGVNAEELTHTLIYLQALPLVVLFSSSIHNVRDFYLFVLQHFFVFYDVRFFSFPALQLQYSIINTVKLCIGGN